MQAAGAALLDIAPRNISRAWGKASQTWVFRIVDSGHLQVVPHLDASRAPCDLFFAATGCLTGSHISPIGDYQSTAWTLLYLSGYQFPWDSSANVYEVRLLSHNFFRSGCHTQISFYYCCLFGFEMIFGIRICRDVPSPEVLGLQYCTLEGNLLRMKSCKILTTENCANYTLPYLTMAMNSVFLFSSKFYIAERYKDLAVFHDVRVQSCNFI